jgi:hypothetical protein
MYILSHMSTLYWTVDIFLSYHSSIMYSFMDMIKSCHGGMDAHCMFGGHTLSQYFHASTTYLFGVHALSQFIPSIGIPA